MAKVALSFDAWKPGAVQPATVEVPVQRIEADASAQLRTTLKGQGETVWQVAWAPDGKTLAALSITGGEVILWDVAARQQRATLRSDLGESYSLGFTPDGKTLVIAHYRRNAKGGPTGGISLWDTSTGQRRALLQHTPPRGVARLVVSPDGKTIAAAESWNEGGKGAYKSCLTLWDISTRKAVSTLDDKSSAALAFSPDGKVLAWTISVIKDNRIAETMVCRHDLTTGRELPALANTGRTNPLNCLAWSADGRMLAAADFTGNIIMWDCVSAKVRTHLKEDAQRRVRSLAFSPDGKNLAVALGDRLGRDHEPGLIALWDTATGQRRLVLTGHTNEVLSVAFSPDGNLLASGSSDQTVRLWDVTALPTAAASSGGR
jgi:WD40 repeat protein